MEAGARRVAMLVAERKRCTQLRRHRLVVVTQLSKRHSQRRWSEHANGTEWSRQVLVAMTDRNKQQNPHVNRVSQLAIGRALRITYEAEGDELPGHFTALLARLEAKESIERVGEKIGRLRQRLEKK